MLVLSSPSGAGKSTLSRMLLAQDPGLTLSISVTTRPRRQSEVDRIHYYFIDPERFAAMREHGELLEWANVHGNLYGTPRAPVEAALAAGRDVLFDIDWQGTEQIKRAMPDDVVGVFVLPPSMAELRNRLERRAEDRSDVIDRRLANARAEIAHWPEYEYVIVNRDLQDSFAAAQAILATERGKRGASAPDAAERMAEAQRRDRQPGLPAFVAELLAEGDRPVNASRA
jgi:guanylate kinase